MSHFTTMKTKIKERPYLIEALELMGHDVQENKQLVISNPSHAEEHAEFHAEVAIKDDVGFRWNKNLEAYELVAELDTWDLDVPVNRFIDKLTQQYAIEKLKRQTTEEGYNVESEVKNLNGSVELVVSRWV